jgi:cation diffusion facilitator CzcD-associated flavoprotein CzcO
MDQRDFLDRISQEFSYIHFPESSWALPSTLSFDVVIIGAGMTGLALAFALKRLGVSKIGLFDRSDGGYEGPWLVFQVSLSWRSFSISGKKSGECCILKAYLLFQLRCDFKPWACKRRYSGIGVGAARLACGIASELFGERWKDYCQRLKDYQTPELGPHLR